MKKDKTHWGSTSLLVGAVIAVLALARGSLQTWLLTGILVIWGIWAVTQLLLPSLRRSQYGRKFRGQQRQRFSEGIWGTSPSQAPETDNEPIEQVLLRHVNHRISAYLQAAYPGITWEWCEKDPAAIVCRGGVGRIRVFGATEFDHADVKLDRQANIACDMIRTVPLTGTGNGESSGEKIPPNSQPIDPHIWYEVQGRQTLETLVSDLNSRGHSRLLLNEDGDVCVEEGNVEVAKEHLANFPEKTYWPRLVQVLESNGLAAEITAGGIRVSW